MSPDLQAVSFDFFPSLHAIWAIMVGFFLPVIQLVDPDPDNDPDSHIDTDFNFLKSGSIPLPKNTKPMQGKD